MAGCAYMCGGADGGQHRPNEIMLFDLMYQQATTSPDERCEWLMVFDTDECSLSAASRRTLTISSRSFRHCLR